MGYARRGTSAARILASVGAVGAVLLPARVFADEAAAAAPKFDTGDTAWMLTSSALVLMMTIPGLALFYGGLVRLEERAVDPDAQLLLRRAHQRDLGARSATRSPSVPTSAASSAALRLLRSERRARHRKLLAPTIPQMLFVAYQATFAIITPALISGTFAERIRFPSFALYMLLWSTFIYNPLAHWVWGGGWIGTQVGALDFAGGTVVHISSGVSALVTALYLGKRVGYPRPRCRRTICHSA